MNVLVFLPPCDGPHLTTDSICFNKEKNNISSTHFYFIYLSYVCTLKHTLLSVCLAPLVYATGWRIPVSLQIKCATFIFITGRWQLLSQDAALIRNPVLYTALGNKLGGEKCEHRIHHFNENGQISKGHIWGELRSRWQPHEAERIYSWFLTFLFIYWLLAHPVVPPFCSDHVMGARCL